MQTLKYQSISCLLLAIVISLPGIFKFQELKEFSLLLYSYIGTSIIFLTISAFLYILHANRKGFAKEINQTMDEAGTYFKEDIRKQEYTILNRPKWIVFITISWIIIFLAYISSALLKSRLLGEFFFGFNTYNIIMFTTIIIGLYFFWNLNPNGYLILAGVCIYNLFRIITLQHYIEFFIWLYPIISLIVTTRYFRRPSQPTDSQPSP